MENYIKIILSGLLLICLLDMPYGYYQLIRVVAVGCFLFLANEARNNEKKGLVILYITLALLFQPIFKIALGRQIWNFVDVMVAIFLVTAIFIGSKNVKNFK